MEDKFVKTTSAVYKLLEFFPETEPLKNRTKEKALLIMENLTLIFSKGDWIPLKAILPENKEKASEKLLEDIEILLSFLKLGKCQGWINDVNFLIIYNEYEKIKKEIIRNFPMRGLFNAEPLKTEIAATDINKQTGLNSLPLVKAEEKSKEKPALSENYISERQKKILKFLKENEKAQVMDLKTILANVTKRTIRRDLDDLLKRGRIIRVGEWNQVFYKIPNSVP